MTVLSASKSSVSEQRLALTPTELHLWLRRVSNSSDSDSFRRETLTRYAAVEPADWRFEVNAHGKPGLVDPPRPLSFNLSHSGDWLACAVAEGRPVGVDLEYCEVGRDVLKLARRFFPDFEVDDLSALPPARRVDRFYDYWTLKEAWVKARGVSLAPQLLAAGFDLDADADAGVALRQPDPAFPADFWLFDLGADYRLALCAGRVASADCILRIFEALPGGGTKSLKLPLRAASDTAGPDS